jgi:predicted DNA-binding antitoxin AbrB/MazE fold protein
MLNTIRAIVKDGKIELLEHIDLPEGTEILVTPLLDDTDFWSSASRVALEKVWDNSEDDVYGELLAR